ncbi:long-chain fatty acid--CoA ligase [Cohnella lubricantis]|uniref:Long-chain fatty acid--CoA ligase n=1 Tax=Cohnella lubricantis TaxID=2163172 RepID=A0A841TD94_9BACL|nr:long-chain fatty acid--CoA ligase [Cohnella lubricantis]MBB6678166.1 long-chain fatty acid--CoA ligase [Cohnella lubricantis]MBP2119708.1 long-chain acyl-CoA synthetase [Cohnella lubricantis]
MPNKPWLQQYPAEVPPTYTYPLQNLASFLLDAAANNPQGTAIDFMGFRMTYRQLLASTRRFANALLRQGVRKGERVAIMLPNCPQTIIAHYGALMMGAVVVMTNPMYMPRELEHQLEDSGATTIVVLDQLLERVRKSTERHPLARIIVTAIRDYLPFPKNVLFDLKMRKDGQRPKIEYGGPVLSFRELLKGASEEPVEAIIDPMNDLALIQYTGGTTGLAKGVMLTHHNLVANAIQCRLWFYKAENNKETFLAALPFFHVFGLTVLLHLGIYSAGTLVLLPRFEIGQVLRTIHGKRPTVFPGAPTMYIAIINHPDVGKYDLSSINICISGAAPLPQNVQERFEALTGGRLIEGYGLTEASPVTHANNIWEKRKNGSIGLPFPDTDARIVHPDTFEDAEPGEIGELAVRGPQVMKGYWNRPEETARVLQDGWLLTGDLGSIDEEGFTYIIDRRKDLIIAGGYNIYPREVEEVLFEHPAVEEAAVAGVVDPYRGETVKAYIVLRKGATAGADEMKQWCKERLAAYKVPKIIEFREALPKTMAGKVLRRKLIEEEEEKARTS